MKKRGCFDSSQANHREFKRKKKIKARPKTNTKEKYWARSIPYVDYLKSEHWIRKKKQALKFYHNECSVCKSREYLQVHHLNYDNLGYESMNDLTILCKECHKNHHEGEKFWIKDQLTIEFCELFS